MYLIEFVVVFLLVERADGPGAPVGVIQDSCPEDEEEGAAGRQGDGPGHGDGDGGVADGAEGDGANGVHNGQVPERTRDSYMYAYIENLT